MNVRTSPPTPGETAIYDDTLVKTTDGWKFKKRVNWRDDDPYSPNKPGPLAAGVGRQLDRRREQHPLRRLHWAHRQVRRNRPVGDLQSSARW